jgi:hypothetical protein
VHATSSSVHTSPGVSWCGCEQVSVDMYGWGPARAEKAKHAPGVDVKLVEIEVELQR